MYTKIFLFSHSEKNSFFKVGSEAQESLPFIFPPYNMVISEAPKLSHLGSILPDGL